MTDGFFDRPFKEQKKAQISRGSDSKLKLTEVAQIFKNQTLSNVPAWWFNIFYSCFFEHINSYNSLHFMYVTRQLFRQFRADQFISKLLIIVTVYQQ